MKIKVLFSIVVILLLGANFATAQTRAYSYLYSVRDGGIKFKDYTPGHIWYFTFTNNKSRVYLTDKDGMDNAKGTYYYQYMGTENGIHIYQEKCTTIQLLPASKLMFNSDYTRMNWDVPIDGNRKKADGTIVRVLEYKANPEKQKVPTELY